MIALYCREQRHVNNMIMNVEDEIGDIACWEGCYDCCEDARCDDPDCVIL